jgi:SAM-dependent methyltransferase
MDRTKCAGTPDPRYRRCVGDEWAEHWDTVYDSKSIDDVSWFEAEPATSLRLLATAAPRSGAVIDVGAGASFLIDALLTAGFGDITLLDVSAEVLTVVRDRLADRGEAVSFVVANLLSWVPERQWDAWHDRAVFHFLVDAVDRARYVETAARAVAVGGVVVLGCFASDGPTRCSGLPTARYDAEDLAAVFAPAFTLIHAERDEHRTPGGSVQPFTWVVLRRHV